MLFKFQMIINQNQNKNKNKIRKNKKIYKRDILLKEIQSDNF